MKKALMTMVLVALLAGCTHQTELPPEGALYRHYAARQDLGVAQLNGFKLSDTVRVDIVMLQAENDEAWQQLTEEFGIEGDEGTVSWLGDIDDPVQRTQWTGEPVMRVIASHSQRTIGFYRLDNEAQYDALIDYQLEKIENNN
ncbi:MAG: hypothetical protein K6E96_02805 [Bacteroidales bacterium]|nr:hypothetical protein [Bacteroidales bacterium]